MPDPNASKEARSKPLTRPARNAAHSVAGGRTETAYEACGVTGSTLEKLITNYKCARIIIQGLIPMPLRGWIQYFRPGASKRELTSQDFWIRRHLRCLIWRQWKRPETRFNHLRKRGCPKDRALLAYKRRGPWWCSGTPALTQTLNPTYFRQLGLFNLLDAYGAT
jgi:hypothetical protein